VLIVAGGKFDQLQPVGGQGGRFALDGNDGLEPFDRQIGRIRQPDDQPGLFAPPERHPHAAPEISGGNIFCRVIKALRKRNRKGDADDGGAHGRIFGLFS
jgi:hypothetical protein